MTKTRAYTAVMAIVKHKAALKTIKPEKLAVFVHELECSDRWSLGHCQQLSTLKPTARELTFS